MKKFTSYGYGGSPRIQLEGSEASSSLILDPCLDIPGTTAAYHPETFEFIECVPESMVFEEESDENPHAVLLESPIFSYPECGEGETLSWDGSEFVCQAAQLSDPIVTKPLPKSKVDKEIKEQVKEEVEKSKEKDRKPKSKTQPPQKEDQKEAFKLEWWQWSIIGVGALAVVGLIAQNINRGDR